MNRVLLALLLTACTTDEPLPDDTGSDEPVFHPAGEKGPYAVGVRFIEGWDDARDLPMPITVWYPAEPGGEPLWDFGEGVQGAAVASGEPFPVVLFSHGNREEPETSMFLMEHLASHGYVLAAPAHYYDTLETYDATKFLEHTLYRTVDLPRTLDLLLAANEDAEDPLYGALDGERVGAIGHSWGAETIELLSGWEMQVDPGGLQAGVESYGFPWPLYVPDERIDASVSIATCVADQFGTAGYDRIGIPMLYMGGTADAPHCHVDSHAAVKAEATPGARLIRVEDATHYAFTNMCELDPAGATTYDCAAPPRPYDEVHALTNQLVTDFLGLELRGDDRYGASLAQETY